MLSLGKINFRRIRKLNYFLDSFSRQSFAIRMSLDTSMLKEDCPIPKSSNAFCSANSRASSVNVILFCFFFLSSFQVMRNFSSISVMMTFNALAIVNAFFLVIYNTCHLSILTIRQHLYKIKVKGLIVKKTSNSCQGEKFLFLKVFSFPFCLAGGSRTWKGAE